MLLRGLIVAASILGTSSASFNCVVDKDGAHYDLSALAGYHTVKSSFKTPPTESIFTWHINPCGALDESKIKNKDERCPEGTQICGVEKISFDGDDDKLAGVIPVCGDLDGNQGQVKTSKRESGDGLTVQLSGGKWGDHKDLKATVEFVCTDDSGDGVLEFESWDEQELRLRWESKHACKRSGGGKDDDDKDKDGDKDGNKDKDGDKDDDKDKNKDGDKDSKPPREESGWGFFTWLFIIAVIVFGAYVVFTAYVNYNRYGMTGVDVLPHSDTVRDLPFLIRDFINKIINTFAGGSRGGYSAV